MSDEVSVNVPLHLDERPAVNESSGIPNERSAVNESSGIRNERPAVNESSGIPNELPAVNESSGIPNERPAVNESSGIPNERPAVNESSGIPNELPAVNESSGIPNERPAVNESGGIPNEQNTRDKTNSPVNTVCGTSEQDNLTDVEADRLKVLLPGNLKGIFFAKPTTNGNLFDPWVPDTLANLRSSRVVLVPSKVFFKRPDYISPFFNYDKWVLAYEDVNVMMDIPMMQQSDFGMVDSSDHIWKVTCNTQEEVDAIMSRLQSRPSVIQALLSCSEYTAECPQLSVILFLSPESRCITNVIDHLQQAKQRLKIKRHFVIEVDLADAIIKWSSKVMLRKYHCIGGKFRISISFPSDKTTDNAIGSGCFTCFSRRNKVSVKTDVVRRCDDIISVLGSKAVTILKQKLAFIQLSNWIESVPPPLCGLCGKSMMGKGNQECYEIHHIYRNRQLDGITTDNTCSQSQTDSGSISHSETELSEGLETIFETDKEYESSLMSSIATSYMVQRENSVTSVLKQEQNGVDPDLPMNEEHSSISPEKQTTKMDDDEKYRKWLRNDQLFYLPEYNFEKYFRPDQDDYKRTFLGDCGNVTAPEVNNSFVGQAARSKQLSIKQNVKKLLLKPMANKVKVGATITHNNNLPIKAKCLDKEYQIPLQMYSKYAQYGDKRKMKSGILTGNDKTSTNMNVSLNSCSTQSTGNSARYSTGANRFQTHTKPIDDVNATVLENVLSPECVNNPTSWDFTFNGNRDIEILTKYNTNQSDELVDHSAKIAQREDAVILPPLQVLIADQCSDSLVSENLIIDINNERITDVDNYYQNKMMASQNSITKTSESAQGNSDGNVCFVEDSYTTDTHKENLNNSVPTAEDLMSVRSGDRSIGATMSVIADNSRITNYTEHTETTCMPQTSNHVSGFSEIHEHDHGLALGNMYDTHVEKDRTTNGEFIMTASSIFSRRLSSLSQVNSDVSLDTDRSLRVTGLETVEGSNSQVGTHIFQGVHSEESTLFSTEHDHVIIPLSVGMNSARQAISTHSSSSSPIPKSSHSSEGLSSKSNQISPHVASTSKRDHEVMTPVSILRLSRQSANVIPRQFVDEMELASIQAATRENTWVTSQETSPRTSPTLTPDSPMLTPEPPTLTPEPRILTPEPPMLTPKPSILTPEQSTLTTEPPMLTPEPLMLTPELPILNPVSSVVVKDNPVISFPVKTNRLTSHTVQAPSRRREAFQEIELDISKAKSYSFTQAKSANVRQLDATDLQLSNEFDDRTATTRSEATTLLPRPKRPPGFVHPYYADITDVGNSAFIPNKRFDVVNFLTFRSGKYSDDF